MVNGIKNIVNIILFYSILITLFFSLPGVQFSSAYTNVKIPVGNMNKSDEHLINKTIVQGIINSSFYNSLKRKNLDKSLIEKAASIYKWQFDIQRLKRGDNYMLVIENDMYNKPVIAAAYFNHKDIEYYAIRYNDEKGSGYYDLIGKNLRKDYLAAPVNFAVVTSPYTDSRFHPLLKRYKPHLGTDYAAPQGTPIHSVADGIISDVSYTRGNGNYITIIHNNIYSTQYLHMSERAKGIVPGKKVGRGEIIGYVGSTGLATGPHLCFRLWKNGEQVDPTKELLPSNKYLDEEEMDYFYSRRDSLLKVMGE